MRLEILLNLGILIKSFPFDIYPEMKDIPKNDWFDEDGDEEFVPDVPVFKALTRQKLSFIYEGARDTDIRTLETP